MTGFVAVICGLKSEAAAVRAATGKDARISIGVSGANAARAEKIANEFCEKGACAVVSVGVSGGLDPSLAPGDLVLSQRVSTKEGVSSSVAAPTLADVFDKTHQRTAGGVIVYGSDEIIQAAEDKAALFETMHAIAVDMESHGCARAAADAGVPFLVIRAIADPADRALPKAALNAVAPNGSTRTFATLWRALRDPKQFPQLMQLGRDSDAALKTLRRDLGPLFRRLFLSLDL